MIRTILFTSALALAAPAMAQQTATPAAPQAATPQGDQSSDTSAPMDAATPQAATPQGATPAQASPTDAVASIVDTEFPAYDSNSDGQLDKTEFSKWMVALKDQEMKATGKALPAEQVTAWASGAFTTADADKSTAVSKPELVTFLSGGAA